MTSYNFVINTGTVVADTSTIQDDVEAEFKNALGSSIDLASATPAGSLVNAEVIARTSVMKNNADLANTINPDLSYGVFLAAICALLGIQNTSNKGTEIDDVLLVGDGSNTIIVPSGSRVKTSNGDIFDLKSDTTITNGGSVRATFISEDYGDIPVPIGDLTIIDGTIGWGSASVDATSSVTAGTVKMTDPQLKIARNRRLATQGTGSSAAIEAAASNVANVTSVKVVENNTGQTATDVNGVTFTLPNAMWICVAGSPTSADVAAALYAAHQGGCPWDYGAEGEGTPVDSPTGTKVKDPVTGLSYYVKYTTPIYLDGYVNITVKQNNSVSSPVPTVQSAITNYVEGNEQGEPGLVVGANMSSFEMAGAVARQIPGLYIKSCKVAAVTAGDPAPADSDYVYEYEVKPWQQITVKLNNINVTIES